MILIPNKYIINKNDAILGFTGKNGQKYNSNINHIISMINGYKPIIECDSTIKNILNDKKLTQILNNKIKTYNKSGIYWINKKFNKTALLYYMINKKPFKPWFNILLLQLTDLTSKYHIKNYNLIYIRGKLLGYRKSEIKNFICKNYYFNSYDNEFNYSYSYITKILNKFIDIIINKSNIFQNYYNKKSKKIYTINFKKTKK
jgi:hypothetical protein